LRAALNLWPSPVFYSSRGRKGSHRFPLFSDRRWFGGPRPGCDSVLRAATASLPGRSGCAGGAGTRPSSRRPVRPSGLVVLHTRVKFVVFSPVDFLAHFLPGILDATVCPHLIYVPSPTQGVAPLPAAHLARMPANHWDEDRPTTKFQLWVVEMIWVTRATQGRGCSSGPQLPAAP